MRKDSATEINRLTLQLSILFILWAVEIWKQHYYSQMHLNASPIKTRLKENINHNIATLTACGGISILKCGNWSLSKDEVLFVIKELGQ